MSNPTLRDSNRLLATTQLVDHLARDLGLDFSEQSLLEIGVLTQLVTWSCKCGDVDFLDERGFHRGFKILDKIVADLRSAKPAGNATRSRVLKGRDAIGDAVKAAAQCPSPVYEGFKKFTQQYPGGGVDMNFTLAVCASYLGEVARRNLGGSWVVRRKFFGEPESGVQIGESFYSQSVLVKKILESPLPFYIGMKSDALGLPMEDLDLSGVAPASRA